MQNSVDQRVIDFTAGYSGVPPESISDSTTMDSIGIVTEQDRIEYMMELEDSFELTYEDGDAKGIALVGDATALINKKLG